MFALKALPADWQPPDVYESFRDEALPEDWPVVSLALMRGLPVWSQDKDFEETRLEVYSTAALLDVLRDAETG